VSEKKPNYIYNPKNLSKKTERGDLESEFIISRSIVTHLPDRCSSSEVAQHIYNIYTFPECFSVFDSKRVIKDKMGVSTKYLNAFLEIAENKVHFFLFCPIWG
jgi:hypothetical protein